jgi:hypothetical protein
MEDNKKGEVGQLWSGRRLYDFKLNVRRAGIRNGS